MAAVQQTFTAATSWTLAHPWAPINPYATVIDTDGNTRLVAPDYSTPGQVTITFGKPIAGTLTLIGPDDSGGGEFVPPAPQPSQATGPSQNAQLIEIRSAPAVDENGDQTVTGDLLWAGQAAAYLKRQRQTVVSGGQSVKVDQDLLYVRDLSGVPVIETPGARWEGSQVLIDDMRTGSTVRRRFTVAAMQHSAAGTAVDSLRLELTAEQAA